MRLERPIEPNNCGENPEQWSAIAAWESVRADQAESKINKALRVLMEPCETPDIEVMSIIEAIRILGDTE